MPGIKFDITGDNQHFINAMNGVQNSVHQTMQQVEASGASIESVFNRIASVAGIAFSVATIKDFAAKVRETRSYFQDIESTMEVFLGNQQKAADFTRQLKDYAYYNMFDFSDLAMASKQMIAYHTEVDDVIPELDKLSNIATGTKQPLMELVGMYNGARSVGYVASQQLAGWARQGILVKDVLKEMGQEVKTGGVTFQQLQMVIDKVTGEGGMFHNLMANQMENISAEAGQLADTLDLMYDEIGRKYEDVFVKGYKAASEVAENFPEVAAPVLDAAHEAANFVLDHYKEIGTVIMGLITTYGAYKAALIATREAEKVEGRVYTNKSLDALNKEIDSYHELLRAKGDIVSADLKEAASAGALSEERAKLIETQRQELNKKVVSGELSPEQAALISQKQVELGLLEQEHNTRIQIAQDVVDEKQAALDAASQALDLADQENLTALTNLSTATENKRVADERVASAQKLVEQYQLMADAEDAAFEDIDGATEAQDELAEAIKEQLTAQIEMETAAEEANTAATNLNTAAETVNTLEEQLNTAQTELNTVATGTNTTAEATNTTSTAANTAALSANTLGHKLHTIALKVGAQTTLIFRAAVDQAKNAMNGLKVAIMSNPLGVLIGLLTTVIPLIMQFFGEEETAEERTRQFGDSADEATSKVNSLYAVLESADTGTKVSKDALSQLIQQYNEYGIILDETIMKSDDESAKIEEVTKHREELIEVIKREAIERQAAEKVSSANTEYNEEIDSIKDKIKKSIGGEWSDAAKDQLVDNFISDDFIESISSKMRKYETTVIELRKQFGSTGGAMKPARDALEEYNKAVQEATEKVEKMGIALGYSQDDIEDAKKAILGNVRGLIDQRNALDDSIDATNEARQAALKASGALDENTIKLNLAKKTLGEIKTYLENIAKRSQIDIDINVTYNETNPMPEPLKHFTSEQWQDRARQFAVLAEKHPNGVTLKDKQTGQTRHMTQQELLEEGVRATNEGNKAKKNEEAAKKEAEKKAEEDKKKAEARAKEAARAAAKRQKDEEQEAKEKADRQAEMIAEEQEFQDELAELRKKSEDAQIEAQIAAIQNDAERERMEHKIQHEKTLREIEEQIDDFYKKIYEQRKRAYERNNKGKKYENTEAGKLGWQGVASENEEILSTKERQQIELARETIKAEIAIKEAENFRYWQQDYQERIASMREYLKEYGTMEERRLAVTEEFEERIARARNEGERMTLQAQRKSALDSLDREQADGKVDWEGIFGDIEYFTVEQLRGFKETLRARLSDSTLSLEEYKTAAQRIDEINDAILTAQEEESSFLGISIRLNREKKKLQNDYNEALERQQSAQAGLATAQMGQRVAREEAERVVRGTGWTGEIAPSAYDDIIAAAKPEDVEAVRAALENLAAATQAVTAAEEKHEAASNGATRALRKMQNFGGLKDWWKANHEFLEAINANIQSLPDLMGNLGVDPDSALGKGVSGMADAANSAMGAMQDYMSGNYIGAASKALDTLGSLGDSLGALGIGGGLFGASDQSLASDIEELTASNAALEQAMGRLTEEMMDGAVAEAADTYAEIVADIDKTIANTQEMMQRSAAAYSNGFLGVKGKGSSNKKIDKGLSAADWQRVSQAAGRSVAGAADFWTLTSKQMSDVAAHAPELYARIKDLADDGYADAAKFMDDYIEKWRELEEAEESYREKLTSTTFDSVYDSFMSSLADMDKSAWEFAQDFEQYMFQALLNAQVGDAFRDRLEEWYKEFSKAMEDKELSAGEQSALREEWQRMAREAVELRDEIAAATGYGDSYAESGTFKSASSFTQEQGDILNGRLTAIQTGVREGNLLRDQIRATLATMSALSAGRNTVVSEIRDMMVRSTSHLEDISLRTRKIFEEFGVKLDRLVTNTQSL